MKKWRITGICMAVSMLAASFSPAASAGETEAPEETQIRTGAADYTGRIVVIGAGLKEDRIQALFGL